MKIDQYVIMVSGGPDSMALLDKSFKEGKQLLVAHVNYQKRATAIRDENIVVTYCRSHQIPYEILRPNFNHQGNFQAWARDIRYDFAIELAKKQGIDKILVAHQLDDYLETYLMQKKRGSTPSYFGIKEVIDFKGIQIVRPLLKFSKKQLAEYCRDNGVAFGIDESNLQDDYQRNRIRHQIIEKMTLAEKKALYLEVEAKNQAKQSLENYYQQLILENKYITMTLFNTIKHPKVLLRMLIDKSLSNHYLDELIIQLKTAKKMQIPFTKGILIKEYDLFYMMPFQKDYCYQIKDISYMTTPYFKIAKSGDSFQSVTVKASDFPLTIRNYQFGDYIQMTYGKKKLSRWFIDHKILTSERKKWPVLLNAQNEIILVPKIGCNFSHYSNNPSFFVIQL